MRSQDGYPALAEAFHVHDAGEVAYPAEHLSGARYVGAVAHRLAGWADGLAAAYGAPFRDAVALFLAGSLLKDRPYHLRYHVARPLDDDGVALADVLAPDIVLIVEGGLLDDDPADLHWLEDSERVQAACAADVDSDALELRRRLHRRELVGDGPARLATDVT